LELNYCINNSTTVANRYCKIPLSLLTVAPYLLNLGDSIYASIEAQNFYGWGQVSAIGNGATCVFVPTKPLNLTNNGVITS